MKKQHIIYGVGAVLVIIGGLFLYMRGNEEAVEKPVGYAQVNVLAQSVQIGTSSQSLGAMSLGTTTVQTGSYMKTGERGRALLALGKSNVLVDYNSELTIEDKTDQGSVLNLILGSTWSRVEKLADKGEYHEIKTKNAVASVRGTSFAVRVVGDLTTLYVASGTVRFGPIDENGNVDPSRVIFVTSGMKAYRDGNNNIKISKITDEDMKDPWYKENVEADKEADEARSLEAEKKTEEEKQKENEPNVEADNSVPDHPAPAQTSPSTNTTVNKFELTSVSPNLVDVGSGEKIVLTGRGFMNARRLLVNKSSITFDIISDTRIEIIAGEELPQGLYDVTIESKSGEVTTLTQALEVKELGRAINESQY